MTEKKDVKHEQHFFPHLEKYDISSVKIEDKGLERYINLETKDFFLGAPHANRLFGKSKLSIIERLVGNLMRTEVYSGKKTPRSKPRPRSWVTSPTLVVYSSALRASAVAPSY